MHNSDGVREERTGTRCLKISERHRQWGLNCPAVDIDFLMVEYDQGKPVAIVEYKEKHWDVKNTSSMTINAIKELAGSLPFLIAVYDSDDWSFIVHPINGAAKEHYKDWANIKMSERNFVESLYAFRKLKPNIRDREVIQRLNDNI